MSDMQFQSPRRLSPGPKGVPIFDVLFDYNQDPTGFSLRCAQEFGEISLLPFGPLNVYLLSNPKHVSEVLSSQSHRFVKGVSTNSSHTNRRVRGIYDASGLGLGATRLGLCAGLVSYQ